MGEAYKGLTIRIGADTEKLQEALSAVNRAARSTQQELNLINRALNIDPSNVVLMNKKMTLLSNEAEDVRANIMLLRRELNEMKAAGLDKAAKSVQNVKLNLEQAKSAYNSINASQERMANTLEEYGKKVGVAFDKREPEQFFHAITNLESAISEEATEMENLTLRYIEQRKEWVKLRNEYDKAISIAGFDKVNTDIATARSKLKSIYEEMLKIEYSFKNGKYADKLKSIDARLSATAQDASVLASRINDVDRALNLDSGNVEAVYMKCKLLNEEAKSSAERMKLLKEKMDLLSNTGINDASSDMVELRKNADKAGEDFKQAASYVAEISAKIDTAKADMQSFERFTSDSTDEVSEAKKQAALLAKEIEAMKTELSSAKKEADRLNDEFTKAKRTAQYKEIAHEVEALGIAMSSTAAKANSMSISTVSSMRDIATTLSATITPVVIAGFYRIVNSADEVDSAYRNMAKTVNGTEEQLEALRKQAFETASVSPVSASTILEIEALGGQLGIAVENLKEFADVASNLDIATDMDAETIAEQLGQLSNILEWGEGDMGRYGDALVRLGNNMPAQESKISSITQAIGAAGKIFGMTTPEILAWASTIAATGQGAEAAGTAISNTMYDIESAVVEGGDALEAFASVAGMTANEFSDEWRSKPSDAMKKFVNGLREVEAQGDSASSTLDELEIRGVRQVRALLSLSQTVGTLDDALQMSEDAWNGITDKWGQAGDAANEAAKKAEGFSGKMQNIRNSAEELGSTIGDSLVPFLSTANDVLRVMNGIIEAMPDGMVSGAAGMTILAAAAAPLARVVAQGAVTFMQFKKNIDASVISTLEQKAAMGELITRQEAEALLQAKLSTKIKSTNSVLSKHATALKSGAAAMALLSTAIMVVLPLVQDYIEDITKCSKSADALANSVVNASAAISSSATSSSSIVSSVMTGLTASTDSMISKVNELADNIKSMVSESLTKARSLGEYGDIIDDLAGKSGITADEQAKLEAAVKAVGDATGQSMKVVVEDGAAHVETADGIRMEVEAIYALIEAKKEQLAYNAYESAYKEAVETRVKLENEYNALLAEQADLLDKRSKTANTDEIAAYDAQLAALGVTIKAYFDNLEAARKAEGDAADYMAIYRAAIDDAGGAISAFTGNSLLMSTVLANSNISWSEFIKKVTDAGASMDAFKDLSADDMRYVVDQIANGTDESAVILEYFAGETKRYADVAGDNWKNGLSEGAQKGVEELSDQLRISESNLVWFASQCGIEGDDAMLAWIQAVKDNEGGAQDAIKEFASKMLKELDVGESNTDDGSWAKGRNFVKGFGEGMSSLCNWITERAKQVARWALNAISEEGEEGSPWRTTFRSGRFFDEGFISGMESLRSSVRKTGKTIANSALSGLSGSSIGKFSASVNSSGQAAYQAVMGTVNNVSNSSSSNVTNVNVYATIDAKDLAGVKTATEFIDLLGKAKSQYVR